MSVKVGQYYQVSKSMQVRILSILGEDVECWETWIKGSREYNTWGDQGVEEVYDLEEFDEYILLYEKEDKFNELYLRLK